MKSLAYKHLESEISRRIQNGIYLPGAQLPTEKELVREFNVSRMTVSKGLSSLIQAGTIQRVRGRGTFVTGETRPDSHQPLRLISLLLPSEAPRQPFRINSLLESITQNCQIFSIQISVEFYHTPEEACAIVRNSQGSQGLICWPCNNPRFAQELNRLIASGQPVVMVDNLFHDFRGDFVGTDNFYGAELMVNQLFQLGHRRIAYLTYPYELSSLAERAAGMLGACARTGISLPDTGIGILPPNRTCMQGELDAQQHDFAVTWLRNIMALKPARRPTAIFTSNDSIAIALMDIMRDMDIAIPHDMSLVSFDNVDQSAWLPVPLTTLEHDFRTIGQLAGYFMAKSNRNTTCGATRQFRVKPKLIARDSLAPLTPEAFVRTIS